MKMLEFRNVEEGVKFFNWLSDEGVWIIDLMKLDDYNDVYNKLLIYYRKNIVHPTKSPIEQFVSEMMMDERMLKIQWLLSLNNSTCNTCN